ncbi:MAG: glycosyltransferase [Pseudomonadota bacterium]
MTALDAVHVTTVHQWNDPRILAKECRSLAEAGYAVALITTEPTEESRFGVPLIGLKRRRNRWTRMTLGVVEAGVKALRSRAGIVHFHDPELIPIGVIARALGRKVVFDVHEDYATSIRTVSKSIPGALRGILSTAYRASIPLQKALFQIVIAESYYGETYPRATSVLNHPDLRLFERFRGVERRAPATPRLLYTGNITAARGAREHAALIGALPSGSQMRMVGRCDPTLLPELTGRAGLSLDNGGAFAPFERIVAAYDAPWTAGLALFPPSPHYTRKALTKVYEYAAAGIPTICSDFPAWRALVEGNGIGIAVPPDDIAAQVAAVERLSTDPKLYARLSRAALDFAHDRTSWRGQAAHLVGLYGRLSGRAAA